MSFRLLHGPVSGSRRSLTMSDAYNGDIRCRREVSERLAHDVRQGAHARRVMEGNS